MKKNKFIYPWEHKGSLWSKIKLCYRQYGLLGLFKIFLVKFTKSYFCYYTKIYFRRGVPEIENAELIFKDFDLKISILKQNDIDELLQLIESNDTSFIQKRLNEGDKCFISRHKGAIVFYCWVAQGEKQMPDEERPLLLKNSDAYIFDCFTRQEYRGKNIYSNMLNYVASHQGDKVNNVHIAVVEDNYPSVAGIQKAGFKEYETVTYLKIGHLRRVLFKKDTTP